MLAMKTQCERCHTALQATGEAYICSFECTWCAECAVDMRYHCPNCSGELVRRPKRQAADD